MKIDKLIKLSIITLFVFAVGCAGIYYMKNKVEKDAKKIYESRSMLKVLESRDENYSLLKIDYPIVKKGLPFLKDVLPKEDKIEKAVSDLDMLAVETGNTQNLVFDSPANAEIAGEIKGLGFSASLDGNFGSFQNYFKKLRTLPYFIEIKNVGISNSSGIFNNNGRLTYRAKLYIKK